MTSCKLAVSCIDDAQVRVIRPTYANRYRPESDVEFVKSLTERKHKGSTCNHGISDITAHSKLIPSPMVIDSYTCRQMYLRSYPFVRKESMQEKTRRHISKVREKMIDLPLLYRRRESSGLFDGYDHGYGQDCGGNRKGDHSSHSDEYKKAPKTVKKRFTSAEKLMRSIFRRLLSCTTRVNAVDGSSSA